jgi:hypothetical protein
MLGWLNSELITTLVEMQSNDGKFMSGIIKHLPWKDIPSDDLARLASLTEEAVSAIRLVFSCEETNSCFSGMPFAESIAGVSAKISGFAGKARTRTSACDTRINEIVYKCYPAPRSDIVKLRQQLAFVDSEEEVNEISEDGESEDTTHTPNSTAKGIMSICVGAIFSRWSHLGIITPDDALPNGSPFDSLPDCSPTEKTGSPFGRGVAADDADHPDDIIRHLRDVVELIWKDRAEAIEKEVCEILGVKELRDYFRKPGKGGFWDDHVSRYSKKPRKAPIYWLLQSSKKNYGLWLYYHRLDKDILFKALLNYVEPKIRLEQSNLDLLRTQKAAVGDSGREAKRLAKEMEKKEDFLSELRDFEDKLRRAANLNLEPDLNDGVVLNIAPLHELVPWNEAKKYWKELLEGKYEWSSIGKQLREKGLVPC